jgi:hypothetical protein
MADSYKLMMYYPALDELGATDLLGYVDSVTITGLPSGWPSGETYYWWVQAHHGDGTENFGVSYGTGDVTIATDSGQEGIYGQVTYNGAGVTGIHLELRFYDGSDWSTRATTVTGADGDYQFNAVPGLSSGQVYYVRYMNGESGNADNPDYLFAWYASNITAYTAGSRVPGGDFDIADIPLVSPGDGASVTLPTTFSWTKRNVTADSYTLVLVYFSWPVLEVSTTPLLGYVDDVTITDLPSGWPSGGTFLWWVEAHHGDGTENVGVAYGTGEVTIFYSFAQAGSDVFTLPFSLSSAEVAERHERVLQLSLEQSP